MGKYRFKLSDMIPNAWFYKLKEMNMASRHLNTSNSSKRSLHPSKAKASTIATPLPSPPKQALLPNRVSYYFPSREEKHKLSHSPIHPKASDTHFPRDPSRKSNKLSPKWRPIKPPANLIVSSVSSTHDIHTKDKTMLTKNSESGSVDAWPDSCSWRSLTEDFSKFDEHDAVTQVKLPPILVKCSQKVDKAKELDQRSLKSKLVNHQNGCNIQKQKKKIHSYQSKTRVAAATAAMAQSKGLSESFAVVKLSSNPHKDFRDSMLQMILENNIRAPKDLENLLACYLTLNSEEYHDLIVEEFKQLWLDLAAIKL